MRCVCVASDQVQYSHLGISLTELEISPRPFYEKEHAKLAPDEISSAL